MAPFRAIIIIIVILILITFSSPPGGRPGGLSEEGGESLLVDPASFGGSNHCRLPTRAIGTSIRNEVVNLLRKQALLFGGLLDDFDGGGRRVRQLVDLLIPVVLQRFEIVQKLEERRLARLGQLVQHR
jgi:hypothetical protein